MKTIISSGTFKKFRRMSWKFQQTVELPVSAERERFVSTIIAALGDLESAELTIDEVVFKSERIASLCPVTAPLSHDATILAQSSEEMHALLIEHFLMG